MDFNIETIWDKRDQILYYYLKLIKIIQYMNSGCSDSGYQAVKNSDFWEEGKKPDEPHICLNLSSVETFQLIVKWEKAQSLLSLLN